MVSVPFCLSLHFRSVPIGALAQCLADVNGHACLFAFRRHSAPYHVMYRVAPILHDVRGTYPAGFHT